MLTRSQDADCCRLSMLLVCAAACLEKDHRLGHPSIQMHPTRTRSTPSVVENSLANVAPLLGIGLGTFAARRCRVLLSRGLCLYIDEDAVYTTGQMSASA